MTCLVSTCSIGVHRTQPPEVVLVLLFLLCAASDLDRLQYAKDVAVLVKSVIIWHILQMFT